eukprot:g54880.t1
MALNALVKMIDFSQAYIHADMEDIIFAVPPEEFRKKDDRFAIWRVLKALYGSPQAGRRWHDYVARFLRKLGYSQSTIDPCVFFLATTGVGFPPTCTSDPKALPWFENLKRVLLLGKFRLGASRRDCSSINAPTFEEPAPAPADSPLCQWSLHTGCAFSDIKPRTWRTRWKLGHVDLRCAIVNQKVEAGLVINEKVGSNDNLADINTKAMRGEQYNRRVRHVAKD